MLSLNLDNEIPTEHGLRYYIVTNAAHAALGRNRLHNREVYRHRDNVSGLLLVH